MNKNDIVQLMSICDPWSDSPDIVDIQVRKPKYIYSADEVIFITQDGILVKTNVAINNRS